MNPPQQAHATLDRDARPSLSQLYALQSLCRGVCNLADSAANDPVNFSAMQTLLGLGRHKVNTLPKRVMRMSRLLIARQKLLARPKMCSVLT